MEKEKELELNKLYVGGLPYDFTDEQLGELFKDFEGATKAFNIPNRGYGFVCFSENEQAEKARKEMDNFLLEGRSLTVNFAIPKREKKRSFLG